MPFPRLKPACPKSLSSRRQEIIWKSGKQEGNGSSLLSFPDVPDFLIHPIWRLFCLSPAPSAPQRLCGRKRTGVPASGFSGRMRVRPPVGTPPSSSVARHGVARFLFSIRRPGRPRSQGGCVSAWRAFPRKACLPRMTCLSPEPFTLPLHHLCAPARDIICILFSSAAVAVRPPVGTPPPLL